MRHQTKWYPEISYEKIGLSNQEELEELEISLDNYKLISFEDLIKERIIIKTNKSQDYEIPRKINSLREILSDSSIEKILNRI